MTPFERHEPDSRFEPVPCAIDGCPNAVLEAWEETGKLCSRCALERDLYDREARRERAFLPVF